MRILSAKLPMTDFFSEKDYYAIIVKWLKNAGPLEAVGFECVSEVNHYKFKFHGSDKYWFPLAKTPSDDRGGKNTISDITQRLSVYKKGTARIGLTLSGLLLSFGICVNHIYTPFAARSIGFGA